MTLKRRVAATAAILAVYASAAGAATAPTAASPPAPAKLSPPAAMTVAKTVASMHADSVRAIELFNCSQIGFEADPSSVVPDLNAKGAVLTASGMSNEQIVDAVTAGIDVAPVFNTHVDDAGSLAWWQAAEAAYPAAQARCDALASDKANAVHRGAYQTQPGPKSYFDSVASAADHGDAGALQFIPSAFVSGYRPDPGRSQYFSWVTKLAESGSWTGARAMAMIYQRGMGAAVDAVAADSWLIITRTRAARSDAPELREQDGPTANAITAQEAAMTADQVTEAHRRADAWVAAHDKVAVTD